MRGSVIFRDIFAYIQTSTAGTSLRGEFMGLRAKLINLEEQAARECTVTIKIVGGKEREMYVENCKKIASCDDDFITLGVFGANIRISGVPLILENFGVNGVKISGKITSVELEETRENGDEK